ncbi:MAG TPA: VanZ family protein [Candidatus Limnocylindrales bacterium]|nr:VanZ family protein [Candidatus Limnocylindrales bacterium]
MSNVPWFGPGLLLSMAAAIVLARPAARILRAPPIVAVLVVLSLGAIAAATLTPIAAIDREPGAARTCDLSNLAVLPIAELPTLDDRSLNVVLFVPLGIATGLVPLSRRRWTLALAMACLPFAIEATQLAVPVLNRGCESGDVVDNLTGLVAGYVAGYTGGVALRRIRA